MGFDSPEERLLRLIKRKPGGKSAKSAGTSGRPRIPIAAYLQKLFGTGELYSAEMLRKVNVALAAILIVVLLYGIAMMIMPRMKRQPVEEEQTAESGSGVASSAGLESSPSQKEPYTAYSQDIGARELFGVSGGQQSADIVTDSDVAKKFNLVGIIPGDKPQAIIEDKETQKTYYLVQGQSVNGITVDDVGAGKVIFSYGGKRIILVL